MVLDFGVTARATDQFENGRQRLIKVKFLGLVEVACLAGENVGVRRKLEKTPTLT